MTSNNNIKGTSAALDTSSSNNIPSQDHLSTPAVDSDLQDKFPHVPQKHASNHSHPHLKLAIPFNKHHASSSSVYYYKPSAAFPLSPSNSLDNHVPPQQHPSSNSNIIPTVQRTDSIKFAKNYLDVAELPSPVCTEMNFINKPIWGGKDYLNTMVSPTINDSTNNANSLDSLLSKATQENLTNSNNATNNYYHGDVIVNLPTSSSKLKINKENNNHHPENFKRFFTNSNNSVSSRLFSSSSASSLCRDTDQNISVSPSNEKQYPDTVKLPPKATFDALRINTIPYNHNEVLSNNNINSEEENDDEGEDNDLSISKKEQKEYQPFNFDSSTIDDKVNNNSIIKSKSAFQKNLPTTSNNNNNNNNIQPLTHSRIFSAPLPKDSPILTRVLDLNKQIINNSFNSSNTITNLDLHNLDSSLMIRREEKRIPGKPAAISNLNHDDSQETSSIKDRCRNLQNAKDSPNLNTVFSTPSKVTIDKLDNTTTEEKNNKFFADKEKKETAPVSVEDHDIKMDRALFSKIHDRPALDVDTTSFSTIGLNIKKSTDVEAYNNKTKRVVVGDVPSPETSTTTIIDTQMDKVTGDDDNNNDDIYIANDFTNVKRTWRKVKELGRGSFSTVILAKLIENDNDDRKKTTDEKEVQDLLKFVAIKITTICTTTKTQKLQSHVTTKQSISKSIIANRQQQQSQASNQLRLESSLQREFEIISSLNHPCIVKMLATNNDFTTTNITILNYCQGGDLFDFASGYRSQITPYIIQRIFSEIVLAVHHLHLHNIVHRDIKLENILLNFTANQIFAMDDEDCLVQSRCHNAECIQAPLVTLTDFGLSKRIDPANPFLETRCGSTDYVAPELLMGLKYDGRQTDSWSLGVLLYALMEGRLPFDAPPPSINPITGQIINKKIRTKTAHRIARIDWCWYFFKDENSQLGVNHRELSGSSPTGCEGQNPQISSDSQQAAAVTSSNGLVPPESPLFSSPSSSSASIITTTISRKSHSVPNSPTVNHHEYTYISSLWKDAKLIVENLLVKRDLRWDTTKILSVNWCYATLPDCLYMEGDKV